MSHKALDSRHSVDACAFQLHSWRPFHLQQALDSSDPQLTPPKLSSSNGFHPKRPCLSDRTTSFSIDLSKLTLLDDDNNNNPISANPKRSSFRLFARKRRRRGSRSVSGRSSDRSGTRRCCSVGASAAYGTCSDFPVAIGTDSSGELFGNGGDSYWVSDVSEARNIRRERGDGGSGEKETLCGQFGVFDAQGNESGYGSEPGYRGDGEFGYGDEVDEEEDDNRLLLWGDHFGDAHSKMEIVGENTFSDQKAHHRCRRKKHDYRMVDSLSQKVFQFGMR
ncbi:hypothetical protein E1A91_D08G091300v1 [Gossypium mustelinum]|uniref:Uncharacterized protein n=3 Tax=Gossypium TaxID=3633 RepID=A0A0D2R1G6_GOSRA|nr:hypothetical protein ES319_D08G089100v1 [Gossypium barbadense]KJB23281.1 hypothetical protein B456_004G089800 [Gossypium raimondii]TYI68481.1 hypothetical protein E1A91_D08G091300v1 [Gossypium mustelinum]